MPARRWLPRRAVLAGVDGIKISERAGATVSIADNMASAFALVAPVGSLLVSDGTTGENFRLASGLIF